jgi:hypothetical protein
MRKIMACIKKRVKLLINTLIFGDWLFGGCLFFDILGPLSINAIFSKKNLFLCLKAAVKTKIA